MKGVYFATSIIVLLTRVKMFIAEVIPAFRGLAMKIIPRAN
ncbi:MAG: hypothetical protein DRJ40_00865 [Thermoprotei archaeon]|nr:MAG: hypothetical protein DRJ40_00865 [Thermoprotei archaeon]